MLCEYRQNNMAVSNKFINVNKFRWFNINIYSLNKHDAFALTGYYTVPKYV